MPDQSNLDRKYFIDKVVYNCPFCNRRNVLYELVDRVVFNWSEQKKCFVHFVLCHSCQQKSMHLSYNDIAHQITNTEYRDKYALTPGWYFHDDIEDDIDSKIFYSVPTSFFVLDPRIPSVIRELVTEAGGCLKMNFLTGASACMRKAIYELMIFEKAEGADYETKIKSLKQKYPDTDPDLFDVLAHIQNMTSDKIHEQSWPKWDSKNLTLIIETLKAVLHELYVLPDEKKQRSTTIQQLRKDVVENKKTKPTNVKSNSDDSNE